MRRRLFQKIFLSLIFFFPAVVEGQVLVDENFERFTKGSEEVPDTKDISDPNTTQIDSSWTQQPGWAGAAVHQAGGVCYISNYYSEWAWGYEDGYLNTPVANYGGKLSFSFRAKSKESGTYNVHLNVVHRSKSLAGVSFKVTGEWQEFKGTLNVEAGADAMEAFVQLGADEGVAFFLDDIKIIKEKTLLPIPRVKGYSDQKADGFKAQWEKVEGITDYLLSVYSKKPLQKSDSIYESFENFNLDEDNKPGKKVFEKFSVSMSADKPIVTEADKVNSGAYALFLMNTDRLELSNAEKNIIHFSFWAKAQNKDQQSQVLVEQLVGNEWISLAEIETKGLADGKFVALDQIIDRNANSIRLIYRDNGGGIYFDDLRVYYEPDHLFVSGYKDRLVSEDFATVTGLEAEVDYYFSVKSKKQDDVSLPSEEVFVYSLLSPVALEAQKITQNSFVAHWEKTPKSQGYVLRNYRQFTAAQPIKHTVIVEKFDKVKVGTQDPQKPYKGEQENGFLNQYTHLSGWMGNALILTDGMIGTKGFGATIVLPSITLSTQSAKRLFKVYVKAWAERGTDLSMKVNANRPETVEPIHFAETGLMEKELTFTFSGQEDIYISFLSWSGEPFLLDEVRVEVELETGDVARLLDKEYYIKKAQTEQAIDNLLYEEYESFLYDVQAYRTIGKNVIFSERSNQIQVQMPIGVLSVVQHPEALTVEKGKLTANFNQLVTIYDIEGKVLYRAFLQRDQSIDLSDYPGVTVVQTPSKIYKIFNE